MSYLLTAQRSVAMARLNVNGRIVNVFSTHLDQNSSATRLAEVKQLVTWSASEPQQRIVAGDFNGWPGTTEINEMLKTPHGRLAGGEGERHGGHVSGESRRKHAQHAHRLCLGVKGRDGAGRDQGAGLRHA